MRLMEVIRLRVKDIDFGYRQIVVRNGKGAKNRVAPLPKAAIEPLQAQLSRVRCLTRVEAGEAHFRDHMVEGIDHRFGRLNHAALAASPSTMEYCCF
jgi:integrase